MVRLKDCLYKGNCQNTAISIPYGSIKRFNTDFEGKLIYISIPYGSIKSSTRKNYWTSIPLFQFLMVRLKVPYEREWYPATSISIPYGSIKSFPIQCLRLLPLISIPYGSIKSLSAPQESNSAIISIPYGSIKSSPRAREPISFQISIPYGSIKSFRFEFGKRTVAQFQFLMVRLKAPA